MSRIGRPPRDREGENARAEAALEQWLQGRAPLFTKLTPAEQEALRVLLGDSEAAVDTVLSLDSDGAAGG